MRCFKLPVLLFFIVILSLPKDSSAQRPDEKEGGKISGRVIDSASGQAIEYATISLLAKADNKVVNGTTTDEKGNFQLNGIKDGEYSAIIYFLGYKKITKSNMVIGKTNLNVTLGDIKLPSIQTQLKQVDITAEKNLIEYKIDKMVYNVEKDVTSQSGVASDVLKKIPQVSVDVDGNVELQGSGGIKFLINGKPSVMFGSNISEVLQTIPASQIQSIEVITSPGAKYDAEGTGGIINIILKKSNVQGINGSVSLSGGTRLENGSVNLNVRKGKFGAHGFFSDNAQLPSTTLNSLDRTSTDASLNQTSSLLQSGNGTFSRNGFQSGAGFDWDINDKNSISGTVSYNNVEYLNNGSLTRESLLFDQSGNTISDVTNVLNNTSNFYMNTLDADLNYKKKFKREGQELEFIAASSSDKSQGYYKNEQRMVNPDSLFAGSHGDNPGTEAESNVALNYTQPFGNDAVLEAGGKAEFGKINGTSNVYLLNTLSDVYALSSSQSNSIDFKRNIYAGYISTTFRAFKWLDVKAGGRSEYTMTDAFYSNSGKANIPSYNTLVPSITISHKFKNENSFKLAYSHRIERPDYRDLNPFVNAADPKNIATGNSTLRPEIGDKMELTYNKFFEKGENINIVIFYRGNKDDIQAFTTFYPTYMIGDSTYTNVAVSTRSNIGRENNFGMNIFGSVPITKKIELRMNLSGFQRYIINGTGTGNNIQGFNYRCNANLTYEVSSTFIMELFGNFNSPRVNAQGTMPASTTYNFALRKQFFKKKASLAITATNPFNKYQEQKTTLNGINFSSTTLRELPYRSFGINFMYRFGKLEFKKEKEQEDPNLQGPGGN